MEYIFDDNGNQLLPEPKTVAQVNEYIKCLIEEEVILQDILVCGEVSNFKRHTSGHFYFTLKDNSSEIKAVMFRSYSQKVRFKVENGQKVIIRARVGVFEQAGTYQLYVYTIQPEGIGDLHFAYEQLKSRLLEEGLFDDAHKKDIPKYPQKIGVITSQTGAAIRDIINVATRRNPFVKLVLFPALVQGEDAPNELISGIQYFNIEKNVDVIIIGRGGGSIEDLWAFNDENLARAIYNSDIPVISGVGHEIDFTICDFVADIRAATPSAAAEIATPSYKEIISLIDNFKSRSISVLQSCLNENKFRLEKISSSKIFLKPEIMLEIPYMKLISLENRLNNDFKIIINKNRIKFTEKAVRINSLNPLDILSRGFATVKKNDKVIKSIDNLEINDEIDIRLTDGSLKAIISSKERN